MHFRKASAILMACTLALAVGIFNPYVTGSSPVARAKIDMTLMSAMRQGFFLSKTKPFVHLLLNSREVGQKSLSLTPLRINRQ